MNALILGASGYIGGAILRRYLREGAQVRAALRSDDARAYLSGQGAEVVRAPLDDPNAIATAADECDVVVHAAGLRDRTLPRTQLGWTHAAGTENVIAACERAGVRRLVFISCADVNLSGKARVHWDEDRMPARPFDAHAETLIRAEEAVVGASAAKLETVVLRPAFVWGPGGKGTWGSPASAADLGTAVDLCREGLRGGLRLFSQGKRFVATTYIDHIAEAAWLAARASEASGSILHVADLELALSRDFYAEISEALGLPAPRRGLGAAPSRLFAAFGRALGRNVPPASTILRRAQSHTFSTERARERLGFEASVSHADGMAALRAWAKDQGGASALAARVGRSE